MSHDAECPFCNPSNDFNQKIIFENNSCYYLQHTEQQEVLQGSGVIVPKQHRTNTFDLTKEEWSDTYELLQQAKDYMESELSPDGYTLGWNVGEASNQSIKHSHLHVIPRFNDEPLAGKGLRHWLKQPENRRVRDN
ncbi:MULTISPECIES: HIT domain-containing protein [Planococcus]|uniref:HIT family protein n=1 Tax=Planococcus faecalis TaxID=1598147 RepID=A0ABN4XIA8_9BACL|nr:MULTISPECIES: HIT domain-containing protein [Planococcus]AQU79473.1 HIT family protein [Planococcus faecalis]MDJ0332553.1 HIT domain-containing protein [Planococcus sp. S3-L1]OHX51440.1 cell-cycle regulation histidine triad HIT protein [Planococcus faecalis]